MLNSRFLSKLPGRKIEHSALQSRFATDGMQNQNGLHTKFAPDPSAVDTDEEGVDGHEPLYEDVFHVLFLSVFASFAQAAMLSPVSFLKLIPHR